MTYPQIPVGRAPSTPGNPTAQVQAKLRKVVRAARTSQQRGPIVEQPPDRGPLLTAILGAGGVGFIEVGSAIAPITSTAYVPVLTSGPTAVPVGFAFTAPISGIMRIEWGTNGRTDLDNVTMFLAKRVLAGPTLGSGDVVSDVNDLQTCRTDAVTNEVGISRVGYVTGLTPGAPYNVQLMWRLSLPGHTASMVSPWIETQPQLR